MKIRLLTLVVALFALVSCNKSTFNVKVELQNAEGKMVYLNKVVEGVATAIDTALIQNNVANFVVAVDDPTTHYAVSLNDRY